MSSHWGAAVGSRPGLILAAGETCCLEASRVTRATPLPGVAMGCFVDGAAPVAACRQGLQPVFAVNVEAYGNHLLIGAGCRVRAGRASASMR